MKHVLLYLTAANQEEAAELVEQLLLSRTVACVNILGAIRSAYRWKGRIERTTEVAIIAKTRAALVREVVCAVKRMHSHEIPCILALPITWGNPAFLRWVDVETSRAPSRRPRMPARKRK